MFLNTIISLLVGFIITACSWLFDSSSIDEPMPEPTKTVQVKGNSAILLGDMGTGEQDQQDVAQGIEAYCKREKCDFGLTLGDNFYPKGVRSTNDPKWFTHFENVYKSLSFKFYPTLGNHDYYGNPLAQVQYKSEKWNMPARHYKLESEHADYFAIDTESFDDEQIEWLQRELNYSEKPWKIVFGHRPVYSNGWHGDSRSMRKKLLPILKKQKVDFYFAGHDHDLELIENDGLTFVISGAGGKIRRFKEGSDTLWGSAQLGFWSSIFTNNEATLSAVGADGKTLFKKVYRK